MSVLSRAQAERFTSEAGGLAKLHVFSISDFQALMVAVTLGDADAVRLSCAIRQVIDQIEAAPTSDPALCMSCHNRLDRATFHVLILQPSRDDYDRALGFGCCGECGTTQAEVRAKAMRVLRQTWPEVRKIEVTHADGGRA